MRRKTIYPNAPAPRLLEEIGATNLTLADAIAEVVANAFDAAIEGEKTQIEVIVNPTEVVVIDNGIGMTEAVLVEAVKLGKDMSKVAGRKKGAKGHFGLGMKTACASIGRWWSVRTRPLGGNSEYLVEFDLEEWECRPDVSESWSIELQELSPPPKDSPLGSRKSGTVLSVRKLRAKDQFPAAIAERLGDAFKPHLACGDSITVNGSITQPRAHNFVPGSEVPIDLQFGTKSEYRITGWVALDLQTRNGGDFGFNIYRYSQLVQTWCKDWFQPHLMTSRIIGEVHMNFIDATFFKQGLQQSDVWRLATAEMKEFLRPVVRASRDLSRRGNIKNPVVQRQIVKQMRDDLGVKQSMPTFDASDDASPKVVENPEDCPRPELPRLQIEKTSLQVDGVKINLSSIEKEAPELGPFDYIKDDVVKDAPTLLTIINTAHGIFSFSKDRDQLRILATADSIFRYLIESGTNPRKAAEARSTWILSVTGAVS
jgi:hypothetical protein